nr:hypothetical protein 5 [Desulfobulbaceae bacterium]
MREQPLLLEYRFRQLQYVIWELLGEQNLLILHRRASKSDLMAVLSAFSLYTADLPIQIICAAPTRIKARDLLFRRVRELLESRSTQHISYNKSELIIENSRTNARLMFFACSEEHGSQARGHLANVLLLDEADEASSKEWSESFLPTQRGLPKEIAHIRRTIISGTPRGSTSLLTQLYAKYHSLSPDFTKVPGVTFKGDEHTPNTPLPQAAYDLVATSAYRVFHLSIEDTGLMTPEELASDRLIMGDQQFRREYYCDLQATSYDVLFPLSDLIKTSSAYHPKLNLKPDSEGHINEPDRAFRSYIPLSAGLDIARSSDATTLYIRQGTRPVFLGTIPTNDQSSLTKNNMHSQISKIESILLKYGCREIAADAGGLGQFFVDEMIDRLQPYDINVTAIQGQVAAPFNWQNEFSNLRSCLYGLAAHAVKNHNPLPDEPMLHEELSAHTTKEQPHDKRTAVIAKKDVRAKLNRSPDLSDAYVYSYFPDAQLDQETFMATLRDVSGGNVAPPTNADLLKMNPEFYQDTDASSDPLWDDSIVNPSNQDDDYDDEDRLW